MIVEEEEVKVGIVIVVVIIVMIVEEMEIATEMIVAEMEIATETESPQRWRSPQGQNRRTNHRIRNAENHRSWRRERNNKRVVRNKR